MSKNRKFVRVIQDFYQQFKRKPPSTVKEQSLWLLRSFIVTKKRPDWVNAGFVLPTVAMVSLVVVLLTIAILFRSFERSKDASNVRVNQLVLNAAMPAIDRAKAKIDKLSNDPRLPRSTPNDFSLSQVISQNVSEFTFGDESQLTLFYDIDGNGSRKTNPTSLSDEETLNTAWKYPVDTDNNGKFDSYTLYSIKFRNPPQTNGNPSRARNPLEARTPPMNETKGSNVCDRGSNTSASLVGSQGWYQRGSTLRRSIFVYTTTVPITDIKGLSTTNYEEFKGNKGFAALEYQQDRERRPLTNNAVLYNDDLEIAPGGGINLNGRILTNSNLLTARRFNNPIKFFLVSSPDSCYFSERNSKIVVGGNVANARTSDSSDQKSVEVHLFKEISAGKNPPSESIDKNNKSINLSGGTQVAYNSGAYEKRIDLLVEAASARAKTSLPTEIQDELKEQVAAGKDETTEKKALLRSYFRKRTRRVPYGEISFPNTDKALGSYTKNNVLVGTKDEMRPPDKWVFPFNPSNGTTHTGYANLALKTNGSKKIRFPAQQTDLPEPEGEEKYLGDRVVVGNNLPQMWWDDTKNKFVTQEEAGQEISGREWDSGSGTRKRFPQVSELDDLGDTGRDGFWEESATLYPEDALDVIGGLRVITGTGIYLPDDYDVTESSTKYTNALKATDKVWSDQMPIVFPLPEVGTPSGTDPTTQGFPYAETPYLQMRATAVYHFQRSAYDPDTPSTNPQTPIACVSSYYDPTNEDTAQNANTYKGKTLPWNRSSTGKSNNGIVYGPPTRTKSTYQRVLNYQAELKYPNGRLINKQLKKALDKGSKNLTLAEKSALDSAICALQIMDGSLSPSSSIIPHGAIRETSFLDARQVKAVDKVGDETNYNLDVELRQPLEIRTTVLDLKALKNKSIGNTTHKTTEYLLPNSGIIYATRDDALPDLSDDDDPNDDDDKIGTSSTDFKLDPTRRPNGIMLINGEELNRSTTNQNKPEEKGLILVSNLPVYIKGDFNKHQHEEFTTKLNSTWSNFYSRKENTLNSNFACRPGQFTGCSSGEKWRSATVIADAITVLSENFELGYRNQGDYDLRDNWGYAALGYDLDKDGTIETSTISPGFNENILKIDLDGDGKTTNTNVTRMSEKALGVDLNNDDDKTDTNVNITEKNIPSVVIHRLNGFWDNNFVTSYNWWERATGFASDSDGDIQSSYFNNFATPIQRRVPFTEYVMEVCRKPTVSACKPEDWVVGYNKNGDDDFKDIGDNPDLKAHELTPKDNDFTADTLGAGTTARPAIEEYQGYPRRIAFLRDATTGDLILDDATTNKQPIPLGITGSDNPTPNSSTDKNGQINYYPYTTTTIGIVSYPKYSSSNRPRRHSRALWFRTINGSNDNYGDDYPLWIENRTALASSSNYKEQPLLIPVLQIQAPLQVPDTDGNDSSKLFNSKLSDVINNSNNWILEAKDTETNLVFAQGDTPARPDESNGGLENFVRYLEKWRNTTHKASGSFIQYKRSAYATAPWEAMLSSNYTNAASAFSTGGTLFGYPQAYRTTTNNQGGTTLSRTPFYSPPNRSWGFDVALLTQLPDLFSQRFTAPPTGDPNEFYREVSRDDDWVSTLLCAAEPSNSANYGTAPSKKYDTGKEYAIPQNQRPSQCK